MSAITLRTIPSDIHEYLLDIQGKIKSQKKLSQYSLEQTVYKVIKEHKGKSEKENGQMTLNVIHLPHFGNVPSHRLERYTQLLKELKSQNILDYKICDGIEATDELPAMTAILRAHKRVVQDAKDNDLPMVCIAEDDIMFTHQFSWDYFIQKIPAYFDLYLASYYSGLETFDNRIEMFRGMTLYVVARKFYDKFLDLPETTKKGSEIIPINIDNALDKTGEFFVCPRFVAIQHPGYSDQMKKFVDYTDRIPTNKLFRG